MSREAIVCGSEQRSRPLIKNQDYPQMTQISADKTKHPTIMFLFYLRASASSAEFLIPARM